MKEIANVRVGRPDTTMSRSSHVRGVRQGNRRSRIVEQEGHHHDGNRMTADARRSTAISPERHDPIDPRSPNLPPP